MQVTCGSQGTSDSSRRCCHGGPSARGCDHHGVHSRLGLLHPRVPRRQDASGHRNLRPGRTDRAGTLHSPVCAAVHEALRALWRHDGAARRRNAGATRLHRCGVHFSLSPGGGAKEVKEEEEEDPIFLVCIVNKRGSIESKAGKVFIFSCHWVLPFIEHIIYYVFI